MGQFHKNLTWRLTLNLLLSLMGQFYQEFNLTSDSLSLMGQYYKEFNLTSDFLSLFNGTVLPRIVNHWPKWGCTVPTPLNLNPCGLLFGSVKPRYLWDTGGPRRWATSVPQLKRSEKKWFCVTFSTAFVWDIDGPQTVNYSTNSHIIFTSLFSNFI